MTLRSFLLSRQLSKNLRLKLPDLQRMQWKAFKAVMKHAFASVPLYHRKLDRAGIKPDDIRSFADLKQIPLTTKSDIQASSPADIVARNRDINQCAKRATSGTTGQPLTVIVDELAKDFWDAMWLRAYFENGLRFRDKIAVIGEPFGVQRRRNWGELLRLMRKEYISIFDDADSQLAHLGKYAPDIIQSYPSSLIILTDAYQQNQVNAKPRLVCTLGELLDRGSRRLISSAFESDVLDNYACAESSLLAWECKRHMGYHMNIDSVVIEFIDEGEPVTSGESGEIIITGLANYAMPLIRYQLGDIGQFVGEQCCCGVTLPLMKILEGRTNDFLITPDGRVISPTVFFPYPFEEYEGIKQFRIVQKRKDKLIIDLVMKEEYPSDTQVFDKARKEISKLFGEGMQVEFRITERIARDPSGKMRKIISDVPVPFKKTAA